MHLYTHIHTYMQITFNSLPSCSYTIYNIHLSIHAFICAHTYMYTYTQITINSAPSGSYTVRVRGSSIAAQSQNFSIAVTGAVTSLSDSCSTGALPCPANCSGVYVCVCVRVCECMYTCMHHMYVGRYLWCVVVPLGYSCMHVFMYVCMYVCMYVWCSTVN